MNTHLEPQIRHSGVTNLANRPAITYDSRLAVANLSNLLRSELIEVPFNEILQPMKVKPEQLENRLTKGLAPLYIISGDEPLLVQEAADLVRQHARAADCHERIIMNVERGFDWNSLAQESCGMSLFAEKRLLELRLPTGKPGDAGGKALRAYAEAPTTDDVLLIIAGKIDTKSQQTKWYKTVEAAGVAVPIWPMAVAQLPAWINQRMRANKMQPTRDAAEVLAERVEGNLLACAQEIDKLFLIHGSAEIDAEMIIDAVTNSARFDIFGLVDAALSGNGERVARMMTGLRGEGVEPILVLWALAREIRTLASMSFEVSRGISPDQVMRNQRVWEKRKPLIKQGLRRSPRQWWYLLWRAGQIDLMIKGQATGNVWDELLQLGLMMAGIRIARAS